ncbi:hypothetical protein [Mycoplasma sp. 125]|uniref:hypothetical protein n=1 Tax=Mycoplasma sp. 125 TaxID=3447505 RepID=UPI003F6590EB
MKKSNKILLTLASISIPFITAATVISCSSNNDNKPSNPKIDDQKKPEDPKKKEEGKEQEKKPEDPKKKEEGKEQDHDKKPHKPSIKLDENAFKNIAPDIIFDYNEPSNEQIQKIINNYYNQYLYQKYDPSKEGEGIRFSFSLEEENKNPLNTDKIIFNKDIIIDGKKQKQKQQEYLKQLSKTIVSDLKNNTQASLSGNNNSITLSLFEKEQQEEILNTFEEHIKNKWNDITKSFVYDETLFTSNNLSVESFKNSISEYYKAADPTKRTIKQLLQDKADVDRYFNMLKPLLGGYVYLKEFGDKFVLFGSNSRIITKEDIKKKNNAIKTGDFEKLKTYRKESIKKLEEKIIYKNWLENLNDSFYVLQTNKDIHRMQNYNIALTQLFYALDELKIGQPQNLLMHDTSKLDSSKYTKSQVIDAINSQGRNNKELFEKLNEAFYATYKTDKVNVLTRLFERNNKKERFYKTELYFVEYLVVVESGKIKTLRRFYFDNKEKDGFEITIDNRSGQTLNLGWKK